MVGLWCTPRRMQLLVFAYQSVLCFEKDAIMHTFPAAQPCHWYPYGTLSLL